MTDREKSTGTTPSDQGTDDEMRPLPDDGLASSMPDWLRRPPAWRDMPRPEGNAEQTDLPEPDTSVIDPRTLVDIDDLPSWLQNIAARSPGPETTDDQADIKPAALDADTPHTPSPQVGSTVEPPATHSDATPSEPAPTEPGRGTPMWIWAMRGAIILSILLVIYYVFFL